MDAKICGRCKQEKSLVEFYKSKRDGCGSVCIPCKKIVARKYNARAEVKEHRKAYWKAYKKDYFNRPEPRKRLRAYINGYIRSYRKHPVTKLKIWARQYTNNAIRAGEIQREPCIICGEVKTEAHHLDYERPSIIMWLCYQCHRRVHKELEE